jgi:RNA polymerase-interacting CarD/CdnL/TRCF family regulator
VNRAPRAPDLPGPALALAVGDLVVYAGHGVGRVTARHRHSAHGHRGDVIVLELPQGLSVTLPVERALETLRPLSSEAEIRHVQRVLRSPGAPEEESWQKRIKATREKVSAGDAVGLAEVVRDGVNREQRSAARERPTPSSAERQLYLKARDLLAHEVGAARRIEPAEADAWILDQIGQASPAPVIDE